MLLNRNRILPAAGLLLAAGAGVFLQAQPAAPTLSAQAVDTQAAAKGVIPFGRFAELHSCELYTGGCTASSEATLEGRYMLRVWKFEGGAGANGTNLAGLSVMLLEKGSENIASAENAAQEAFAYLPEGLEPAQREALVGWVRSQTPASVGEENIRVVPMRAYLWEGNAQVAAGQHIAFSSRRPAPCGPASCGERLWYEPRNAAANFMVEEVASARVSEPALSLSWKDHGRRTLFMGQFGPMEGRTPAFCGNTPGLFTKL